MQLNLIRSHAAGTGKVLDLFRTRRLLLLRINVLAKGHSGISVETLKGLIDAFNADCLSWVPEQVSLRKFLKSLINNKLLLNKNVNLFSFFF